MAVAKKSFRHRMGKFLQWLNPLKAGVAQRLHGRFPPSGFLPLCERQTTPIVAQLVGLFRSLFGAANSRRLGVASGASRCCALRIEALEPRRLLSATYWVNDNWVVTAPQSDIGNAPVAGDTVANTGAGGDGSVTGETFGVNAFATVQDALDAAQSGDTVEVLAGTYDFSAPYVLAANVTIVGQNYGSGETLSGADGVFEITGSPAIEGNGSMTFSGATGSDPLPGRRHFPRQRRLRCNHHGKQFHRQHDWNRHRRRGVAHLQRKLLLRRHRCHSSPLGHSQFVRRHDRQQFRSGKC